MNLKDYFEQVSTESPSQGSTGVQSDWLDFCELRLSGSKLLIVDANFVPSLEDGLAIELPVGRYLLQVKAIDYGGDKRG
ncbi:MAG: hypothetical protein KBH45_15665, partial [Verrucomicrobia bacterium]|nr:hypothetical protein [Verrucomicrobiota bacterium]